MEGTTMQVEQQLYRFSALIPFVVLGVGRRGLGIVQWNFAERMLAIVILSVVLSAATWQILRVVDRRLRQNHTENVHDKLEPSR